MAQPAKSQASSFKLPTSPLVKNLLKDCADRSGCTVSDLVRDAIGQNLKRRRAALDTEGTFVVVRLPADHHDHLRTTAQHRGISFRVAAEAMINELLASTVLKPTEQDSANEPDLFD